LQAAGPFFSNFFSGGRIQLLAAVGVAACFSRRHLLYRRFRPLQAAIPFFSNFFSGGRISTRCSHVACDAVYFTAFSAFCKPHGCILQKNFQGSERAAPGGFLSSPFVGARI